MLPRLPKLCEVLPFKSIRIKSTHLKNLLIPISVHGREICALSNTSTRLRSSSKSTEAFDVAEALLSCCRWSCRRNCNTSTNRRSILGDVLVAPSRSKNCTVIDWCDNICWSKWTRSTPVKFWRNFSKASNFSSNQAIFSIELFCCWCRDVPAPIRLLPAICWVKIWLKIRAASTSRSKTLRTDFL